MRAVVVAHGDLLPGDRAVIGEGDFVVAADGGALATLVTLLPVAGDADGVRTEGLLFPLHGETLRFGRARGLSNEIVALPARVSLERGSLLVFEGPKGGG